ncbi:hypothetical protein K491DRAFT_780888 [Lophiostoma macrostomum CBS 122681]|uniref:Uncharacterized protein n=1 Tax=Lophiostoma macrostomum CBS 122681 TaxID=1314788 RepID=A0A6A6T1I7_9PLEO|nr:hypothetical protein K491DRAFT_780888 [Lophiostoma macrostomum CBS 122681]
MRDAWRKMREFSIIPHFWSHHSSCQGQAQTQGQAQSRRNAPGQRQGVSNRHGHEHEHGGDGANDEREPLLPRRSSMARNSCRRQDEHESDHEANGTRNQQARTDSHQDDADHRRSARRESNESGRSDGSRKSVRFGPPDIVRFNSEDAANKFFDGERLNRKK